MIILNPAEEVETIIIITKIPRNSVELLTMPISIDLIVWNKLLPKSQLATLILLIIHPCLVDAYFLIDTPIRPPIFHAHFIKHAFFQ